jgi:cyanophycinase
MGLRVKRLCLIAATALFACSSSPSDNIVIDLGNAPDADSDVSKDADIDADRHDLADITDMLSDGDAAVLVEPPVGLQRWLTGGAGDRSIPPVGPGLILMGGGVEPDAAFEWWSDVVAGGDIVVIRASQSDGYNDYLYTDIGGFDSVETLLVDSRGKAQEPYVAQQIDNAEAVFLAGGNQWSYVSLWSDTALHDALQRVWDRGAFVGGTSAGLAVLGDRAYSAATGMSAYSDEALADPFYEDVTFDDDFLSLPPLRGVVTDSHFAERDRMGRLLAFVARMWTDGFEAPRGIGVDERTALLLGPDVDRVVGSGAVYEISAALEPEQCQPGTPLEWSAINVRKREISAESSYTISASAGAIAPLDPY